MSTVITPIQTSSAGPGLSGLGTDPRSTGVGAGNAAPQVVSVTSAPPLSYSPTARTFGASTFSAVLDAQESSGLYGKGEKWQTTLLTLR